jgi:hypothetical protein
VKLKATMGYMIASWPGAWMPLTRSYVLGNLYIIDREIAPGCLTLEWKVKDVFYPDNRAVVEAMDELGCMNNFYKAYHHQTGVADMILGHLLAENKAAVDDFMQIVKDKGWKTLSDAYQLKAWMQRLMIKQRGE